MDCSMHLCCKRSDLALQMCRFPSIVCSCSSRSVNVVFALCLLRRCRRVPGGLRRPRRHAVRRRQRGARFVASFAFAFCSCCRFLSSSGVACPMNGFNSRLVGRLPCVSQKCAVPFTVLLTGRVLCPDVHLFARARRLRLLLVSRLAQCLFNNGGCDLLMNCTNTRGSRSCSGCPRSVLLTFTLASSLEFVILRVG